MAFIKVVKVTVPPNITTQLVDENENVVVHFMNSAIGVGVLPDLSNPANRLPMIKEGSNIVLPANKILYSYYEAPIGSSPLQTVLLVASTVN